MAKAGAPMPDKEELDQRFANVMASVNLTPESAQFLWDYDDKKKWNLICEHDGMIVKKSPQEYVAKLKVNFKCFPKFHIFFLECCLKNDSKRLQTKRSFDGDVTERT